MNFDLVQRKARTGGHNPRLIYMDPADKPDGDRGGGPENMIFVVVGPTPSDAAEIAEWAVGVLNAELERMRGDTVGEE